MALALLNTYYRVSIIHNDSGSNIQFNFSNTALVKKVLGEYQTVYGNMKVQIQKVQVYYNTESYSLSNSFTDITEEDLK